MTRKIVTFSVTREMLDPAGSRSPDWCPVARAIRKQFPACRISVGIETVRIGGIDFHLPDWVGLWVRYFDANPKTSRPMEFVIPELDWEWEETGGESPSIS